MPPDWTFEYALLTISSLGDKDTSTSLVKFIEHGGVSRVRLRCITTWVSPTKARRLAVISVSRITIYPSRTNSVYNFNHSGYVV